MIFLTKAAMQLYVTWGYLGTLHIWHWSINTEAEVKFKVIVGGLSWTGIWRRYILNVPKYCTWPLRSSVQRISVPLYIHWKSSLNNSSKVDTKKYSNYNNTTAVAFGGTVTEIFRQQNQLSIISLVFQIKTPGRSHMKTISIQHSVKSNGSQKSF